MNAFEDTMEMLTKEGNKIMADAYFASDKVTEIITTLINEKGSNSVIGILRECVRELDRLWED